MQIRTIVKEIPRPSFFHYFSDPKEDEDEEEEEEEDEEKERIQLTEEEDFEIAHAIRTALIPDAVLWFTGTYIIIIFIYIVLVVVVIVLFLI